jgi:hypothetical protein
MVTDYISSSLLTDFSPDVGAVVVVVHGAAAHNADAVDHPARGAHHRIGKVCHFRPFAVGLVIGRNYLGRRKILMIAGHPADDDIDRLDAGKPGSVHIPAVLKDDVVPEALGDGHAGGLVTGLAVDAAGRVGGMARVAALNRAAIRVGDCITDCW